MKFDPVLPLVVIRFSNSARKSAYAPNGTPKARIKHESDCPPRTPYILSTSRVFALSAFHNESHHCPPARVILRELHESNLHLSCQLGRLVTNSCATQVMHTVETRCPDLAGCA